ncbi:MAG: noncanonical pyrimidine nucleotidase, YjjG family [Saprospiraceae bacterium]|nr:noncanonical pyrimidine nucleotidase, YjjG family [Saprospiraceae bacterium]
MKYQHLFFDLDHTLWDFESNAKTCIEELYSAFDFAQLGVGEVSDFYAQFTIANRHYWALLESKVIPAEEVRRKRFQAAFAGLGISIEETLGITINDAFLELLPQKSQLIDGALTILEYLQPHYQLHIISNGWYEVQIKKMKSAAIEHFFESITTNETANARKPDSAIFEHALRVSAASLQHSLMIGDSYEADIKGAMNVQLDAVFYNPEQQNIPEKPTFEVAHLMELKGFL